MTTQATTTAAAPAAAPAAPAAASTPAAGTTAAQPAAQATTPAADPAATTAAPAAKPPEDKRFARLVLQNRELERRIKELEPSAAEATALKAKLDGVKDPAKRWDILEKELGVRYDEWTEHLLKSAGGKTDPEFKLPPEVEERLKKLDALEGKFGEREKAEQAASEAKQLDAARAVVSKMVTDGGDKYELIGALGAHDAVINQYRKQVEELGEADDHEVAAAIETQLATTITKQLAVIGKTPKGRKLIDDAIAALAAATAASADDEGEEPTQASPRVTPGSTNGRRKTVSNDLSAARGDGVDLTKLTPAEKRARALEAARKAKSA